MISAREVPRLVMSLFKLVAPKKWINSRQGLVARLKILTCTTKKKEKKEKDYK
jgi:hypothetical protein